MSYSILDYSKRHFKDINYIKDPLEINDEQNDKFT